MTDLRYEIAKDLLEIKAVELRPQPENYFTWTSGIQSPIYCDNRLTMSYPSVRNRIAAGLVAIIQSRYPEVTVIAGTSTAGIPHAAWVSDRLDLPMVYVRDSKKKHGKTNQIEGKIGAHDKVVVIEDLISTGISSLKVVEALSERGAQVLGVVAIFSYSLSKTMDTFIQKGIQVDTLTQYDILVEVAQQSGYIQEEEIETLIQWRNQLD
ncbi:orotate phosphoribosyltransferase [Streptococcus sp. 121]|uniref:orotate phosphoribosyltransferase n=1 Tax=Streptococcus sp. 121 TaxID=2797637 RepID=UPI0018F09A00|nr:orotate phosphoribosyltransferase [Streptococcus sp. 121]MBJ6746658.1 orotate phosphoribosyltransferase [Streptococcus sp. 121]